MVHEVFLQDKAPRTRELLASTEAYTAQQSGGSPPKKHHSERRKTEHVSGRIPKATRLALNEIARANGWTESYTVRMACIAYVENTVAGGIAAQIKETITQTIDEAEKRRENRQSAQLARIEKDAAEVKYIAEGLPKDQAENLAVKDMKG